MNILARESSFLCFVDCEPGSRSAHGPDVDVEALFLK